MNDVHLTREILEAALADEVSQELVGRLVFDHLAALCPTCREELRRWEAWRRNRRDGPSPPLGPRAVAELLEATRRTAERLDAARRRAERAIGTPAAPPAPEALAGSGASPAAARGARSDPHQELETARLLMERGRNRVPEDPEEALAWMEAVETVLERAREAALPVEWDLLPALPSLRALAAAHRGDCHRRLGDLDRAAEDFEEAAGRVRREGVTDPATCAEIHSLEGLLLRDGGDLRGATRLLERAVLLFTVAGDAARAERVRRDLAAILDAG